MRILKGLSFTLAFGCLFLMQKASAQKSIVKGVVIEKGSNIRIALANVTNLRTKIGVGSNDLGFFQILADIGDTILLAKRDHEDVRILVKDNKDILIYMLRASNQLKDVNIFGDTKKHDLEEVAGQFKDKGSYYAGKPPLSLLSPFGGSPLTFLYELFGKTPRNARRFARYADNELKESKIDKYFNQTIIKNNSDLTGADLETYMLNCRPDYDKVKNWASYDYIKYIRESSKIFADTLGK